MANIDQLTAGEAVHTLYRAVEAHAPELDLDDERAVRSIVEAAFVDALGRRDADVLISKLSDDVGAGSVARAMLAVLEQRTDLSGPLSADVTAALASPRGPDKLDFGISLGALCLSALAMALMGSVEYERTEKGRPNSDSYETTKRFSFKGSEKVVAVVRAMFDKTGAS